jgi:hypothetical protein
MAAVAPDTKHDKQQAIRATGELGLPLVVPQAHKSGTTLWYILYRKRNASQMFARVVLKSFCTSNGSDSNRVTITPDGAMPAVASAFRGGHFRWADVRLKGKRAWSVRGSRWRRFWRRLLGAVILACTMRRRWVRVAIQRKLVLLVIKNSAMHCTYCLKRALALKHDGPIRGCAPPAGPHRGGAIPAPAGKEMPQE